MPRGQRSQWVGSVILFCFSVTLVTGVFKVTLLFSLLLFLKTILTIILEQKEYSLLSLGYTVAYLTQKCVLVTARHHSNTQQL